MGPMLLLAGELMGCSPRHWAAVHEGLFQAVGQRGAVPPLLSFQTGQSLPPVTREAPPN